ncbi:hypothetical protein F0562_006033 [Nyssa sinensis]|uniref:Uncharacterized protein n=1 Tax=Nyssa sinensis TaxID=561372 RepID=A0A5J5AM26_9ASTE|nr:hypothetical protein F0562_006033 [Nyssa sinensis]
MRGDTLATNSAFRPAIRSLASAAGVHSVEVSIGAGDPITLPASTECTRETHLISNGLELPSTLGIRDIPNASPDVVSLVANQIGGSPQGSTSAAAIQPASLTQDIERPTNYDIQVLKTMEVGASSNATLLDNSDSISAYASQPEFSTKIKDQQESPYTTQPINPMEIGTTSSDPLLDCPAILPRESYQHPSGHVTSMPSNQPPRHNAEVEFLPSGVSDYSPMIVRTGVDVKFQGRPV